MKNCLIIINSKAGSSKHISFDKVENCLRDEYKYTHCTLPKEKLPPLNSYCAVAVCGGDGTLSCVLEKACDTNIDVFYFPVGTLNDKAKAERYKHTKSKCKNAQANQQIVIGKCDTNDSSTNDKNLASPLKNSHIFTYVLACGSFTPIGYETSVKFKQKFGVFAYLCQVFKQYRPYKIKAQINCKTDSKRAQQNDNQDVIQGDFTLLMFVKSPRCFGFHFNKAFDEKDESGHLVAIRSPKHKGALAYIEMFFPFFRVFFLGLKKPMQKGGVIFKQVESATMLIEDDIDFCKDGEKLQLERGKHTIKFSKTTCNFSTINKF